MCCLKYEQDCYEELLKTTPKSGAFVEILKTADVNTTGRGTVIDVNILTGMLKVKLIGNDDAPPVLVKKDDVKLLRDGRIQVNKDEVAALKALEKN
jgi:cell fate regulator YaaT (PSP1 superfamily)